MTINWNETVRKNRCYTVDDCTFEHQYRLEHRPASSLRLHETPLPRRVGKIAAAMRAGESMPIPSIGDDGMILDGHHRTAAAMRVAGAGAVIPTEVHEIVDVTPQAEFLRNLAEHLSLACEQVEAGFYFEEGGCFGMAIALHATLAAEGIGVSLAATESWTHAYVVAHNSLYDYQGRAWRERPSDLKVMTPNEFVTFAASHGHDWDSLMADQQYAQSAIDVALKVTPSNSAPTTSPRKSSGLTI